MKTKKTHPYLSVFMLHAGSTFYKCLLVFAAMWGIQFFLLYKEHQNLLENYARDSSQYISLSSLINSTRIHILFLAAFLLITVILTWNGFEFKEKFSYTIRRLSISEKHYFLLQGLYNSLIYLLLFLIEITMVAAFTSYYLTRTPDIFHSNQTLFLTFYANDFLHSLLPLEETVRVIRNIMLIFTFGCGTAYQSYAHRRGKKSWSLLLLTFVTVLNFQSELGSFVGDAVLICACTIILSMISYNFIKKGDGYEF